MGAIHQCCDGGFHIDENGETTVPGLFAAGEVAAGPHGADRMGGNMLLASQVFGCRAGRQAAKRAMEMGPFSIDLDQTAGLQSKLICPRPGSLEVSAFADSLAALVWREFLVARTSAGLKAAVGEIARMRSEDLPRIEIREPLELVRAAELRNGLRAAEIVGRAALEREESRGGHYRVDFPKQDDANWLKVVVVRKQGECMVIDTWAPHADWSPRETDMWATRWG